MIITYLQGGLGNQMFQYAAGRRLAQTHSTDLKLDISYFAGQDLRKYELGSLKVKESFSHIDEINKPEKRNLLDWFFNKQPQKKIKHIDQKFVHFDPEILNLPDNVYLNGYWQSEKFFIDITDIIRREFTIKLPQTDKNKNLAKQICECESVSIHVRRGDYVSNSKAYETHGVCSLDYYAESIKFMSNCLTNPCFFIFSDDPDWVSNNLKIPYPSNFVTHNGQDKGYEDLRLMSQCSHNIIANSSFSWWGAWLNSNPGKMVIAPKIWFKDRTHNDADICPQGWIKI